MPISPRGQAVTSIDFVATDSVGVARVRITATLNDERYEEIVELPVRPASPEISVGGYAFATPDAPAKLDLSHKFLTGTETTTVTVTPWPSLKIPDGLQYLDRYPYGCAEQTISTSFPLLALSDLGQQIAPGMFAPEHMKSKIQAGILRLIGMQRSDGGVGMWPGAHESWPWASVYALHFITEAEAAGHAVPDDFRQNLTEYVRKLLDKSTDDGQLIEAQAYACYALALADHSQPAAMNRLTEVLASPRLKDRRETDDFEPHRHQAIMHLSLALFASGRKDLAASSLPTVLPQPRSDRSTAASLGSPVRDRAILLETLLAIRPDAPEIPALAQQLADQTSLSRWSSTQDCAFAVMALGKYVRQAKTSDPVESAVLKLGEGLLASSNADKSLSWTQAPSHITSPTTRSAQQLSAVVKGPPGARGYVSWIASGVPLTPPNNADHGMTVRRRYLDYQGNEIDLDSVRSGDLLRVELKIEAPPNVNNVVIEDLLPGGIEIENPRLNTTATGEEPPAPVNDHRVDMRDDRLILVTNGGVTKHTYVARAVTPGTYIIPPVRGECMYDIGVSSIQGTNEKITVLSTRSALVKTE
jgi:uncharacterized protein YfaS (alpha-2-macroglobulin family)